MKRFLALALSAAMCLSLLASCSSSSDSSDEEETEEEEETTEAETEEEETEETDSEEAEEEESETEESEEETEESDSSDDSDEEPVYGGTVNAYYFMEFSNTYDVSSTTTGSFVGDYLWSIDWDVDRDEMDYSSAYITSDYMVGSVAESWEIADDYSYMEVTIRDDVYFQDKIEAGFDEEYDIYGARQLTAEDVKYSYDRLLGLDGVEQITFDMADWDTTLSMLDSVEVVDDYNLIFYFNTTDEVSLSRFMCAFVGLCGEEWDELSDEDKTNWRYACGTGPFLLTDFVNDNTMTYTANPNYWGTDSDGNQLPFVDEVNLIYMTDTATLLASFISGEIDLIAGSDVIFDSDQVEQLEAALEEDEYEEYVYVGDYIGIGLKQGENAVEALTDLDVRTAMQYALDLEALSEFVGYTYDSTEEMLSGMFGYGTEWCDISAWGDDVVESYSTYDTEYAMELLEEAGYADGFSFDVTITSSQDTDLYSLVVEYLADVGIEMNLNVISEVSEMQAIGQDASDPTCVQYSLGCFSLDTLNVMFNTSDSVHYDNEEIDNLYSEFLAATTLEEQIEAAKELDQAYMSEHYILKITGNKVDSRWSRSRLKGYSGENVTANMYYGIVMARVWVDDSEE